MGRISVAAAAAAAAAVLSRESIRHLLVVLCSLSSLFI